MNGCQRFFVRTTLLLLFVFQSIGAYAINVPTDYATIQAALDDLMAGKLASGATIELSAGTYHESLLYADSDYNFTLKGSAGASKTFIDAEGTGKPGIWIRNSTGIITIEGITVRNARGECDARGDGGCAGGILFHNASPTLSDCVIENNSSPDNGGGIRLYSSNAVINNCIVRNNTAERSGGGIIMVENSRPRLTHVQVLNNQAGKSNAYGTGGGIQINNSSPNISASVISGNQAYFAGGGIFGIGEYNRPEGRHKIVIDSTQISNNQVQRWDSSYPFAEGGGLHAEDNLDVILSKVQVTGNKANSGAGLNSFRAHLNVVDSNIENNTADIGMGGGINVNSQSPHAGELELLRTQIKNNTATHGGGILLQGDANTCPNAETCAIFSMIESQVENNQAQENGGGISLAYAKATINTCSLRGNRVTSENGNGGGLRIVASELSMTSSSIADNQATNVGGGLFIAEHSQPTLIDLQITGNRAGETNPQGTGGGIQINDSNMTLRSSRIENNHAYATGGGISILGKEDQPVEIHIEYTQISNNLVESAGSSSSLAEGGGIHSAGNVTTILQSVRIQNNEANTGGGLSSYQARYELQDTVVDGNHAQSGSGGGIFINIGGSLSLQQSRLSNNNARYGGGLFLQGKNCLDINPECVTLDADASIIDSNEAQENGGGMGLADAEVNIKNSTLMRNRVTLADGQAHGGAIRVVNSKLTLSGSVLSDNHAAKHGGALYIDKSTEINISNSLIYANRSDAENGSAIMVGSNGPPTGTIANNEIVDNEPYQLREEACPKGTMFLNYRNNLLADEGASNLFWSPCTVNGIHTATDFNALPDEHQASDNHDGLAEKSFFAASPLRSPGSLFWVQPYASSVSIDDLGVFDGHSGSTNIDPACTTDYQLNGLAKVTIQKPYPGEYVFVERTLTGQHTVSTSKILSVEKVTIEPKAQVEFNSAAEIILDDGFQVKKDGHFTATVASTETCY